MGFVTTFKTLVLFIIITFVFSFLLGGYVFTVHKNSLFVNTLTSLGNDFYNYLEKNGINEKLNSFLGHEPQIIIRHESEVSEKIKKETAQLQNKTSLAKEKLVNEAKKINQKISKQSSTNTKKTRKQRSRIEDDIDMTD